MSFEVISSAQLRQYIEKVERLEEEKVELLEAIREVFGEARGNGFDVKIMKQVLKDAQNETRKFDGTRRIVDPLSSSIRHGTSWKAVPRNG